MRRAPVLSLACAALVAMAGCGGGGVDPGAALSVYVSKPLCGGASKALDGSGGVVGGFEVHVTCLPAGEDGKSLDLAAIGANARRATEDSTTVAYIASHSGAARFSGPILDAAGIAQLTADSGASAMARLLQAIRRADDSKSLRQSIYDDLQ